MDVITPNNLIVIFNGILCGVGGWTIGTKTMDYLINY